MPRTKKTNSATSQKSTTPAIPRGLVDTLKTRPGVEYVFIASDLKGWFFREETAKKYFEKYNRVKNPHFKG